MQPTRTNSRCSAGFTLPELLVVMGIIIIFIALAIPALNVMNGSRSIAAGENNLSAVLVRAREEAIGLQQIRGLVFTLDPGSDRVVATLVQSTDAPPAPFTPPVANMVWLDTVPNRDRLSLPPGIRLQTCFDGAGGNERYMGFNSAPFGNIPTKLGGVILFDGEGRLIVRSYGFRLLRNAGLSNQTSSGFADLFFSAGNSASGMSDPYIPTMTNGSGLPFQSQLALVLIDNKAFVEAGFIDADQQPNESQKELWIDSNSTPLLINRFTGILIRGE